MDPEIPDDYPQTLAFIPLNKLKRLLRSTKVKCVYVKAHISGIENALWIETTKTAMLRSLEQPNTYVYEGDRFATTLSGNGDLYID